MFYKYLISNVNNNEVLYLFLDNRYEVSNEFSKDIEKKSIQDKIKKYIKKNDINFNSGTIYLVSNNIIAASINYNNDNLAKINTYIDIKNNEKVLIRNNKTYYRISLTKYLENNLFNKIPLVFEKEAIKAVSIIIRSNYIKDLYKYGYINDENNYMTKGISDIEKTNRYTFFIDRLNSALKETNRIYLAYKNKPIYIDIGNIFNINALAKAGFRYNEILKLLYPELELLYI